MATSRPMTLKFDVGGLVVDADSLKISINRPDGLSDEKWESLIVTIGESIRIGMRVIAWQIMAAEHLSKSPSKDSDKGTVN